MLVYLIVKTFDFLMTVPHCIMWLYKFMPYLHLKKMEKLCLLTSAIFSFSCLNSIAYLKVFSDFDCADLGVPRKVWIASYQKTKEIEIPTIGSKVMVLGSKLTCFALFLGYLNHFNSDFDP